MAKSEILTTEFTTTEKSLRAAAEDLKHGVVAFIDALTELEIARLSPLPLEGVDVAALETSEDTPVETEEITEKKTSRKTTKKTAVKDNTETEETFEGNFSREDLEEMTYNNLKKLAKDVGIPAKGDRETLINKLLEETVEFPVADDTEESDGGEAPKKTATKKNKSAKKTAMPKVEEPEDDDDEDEVPEDDTDSLDDIAAQVHEIIDDMETSEIADILSDAGISPKGKRQSLIDKVIKAVEDGIISLSDEDDEDDNDESESEEADTDDELLGPNDLNNPDMPKARRTALKELDEQLRKQYKAKKLKTISMKKALKEFYADDEEALEAISEFSAEEVLDNYIDMKQLYVDDDGDTAEDGEAYNVNGIPYCCGTELVYDEDSETFICERCGEEYNAE